MKTKHTMIPTLVLLFAAAALAACSSTDQASKKATQANAPTAEEVAQKAEEAAESAGEYADAQMTRYKADMRRQLEAVQARVDSMQEKVTTRSAELGNDAKAEWNQTLTTLRQESRELEQQLDRTTARSQDAMGEVQRGLDKAWTDLKASVQRAEQEWRDSSDEDS